MNHKQRSFEQHRRPARPSILKFVGTAALSVATMWLVVSWYSGALEYPYYNSIKAGDTRERVTEFMCRPDAESDKFRLGQRDGYEEVYEQADRSTAVTWLIFHAGLDQTFTIGLDATNHVVFKARGGT